VSVHDVELVLGPTSCDDDVREACNDDKNKKIMRGRHKRVTIHEFRRVVSRTSGDVDVDDDDDDVDDDESDKGKMRVTRFKM